MKALPQQPDFIIHTGDVSQLSRDDEFDDAEQMLKASRPAGVLRPRRARHARSRRRQGVPRPLRQGHASGAGWYSFDHRGVHFVALGQRRRSEARRHGQSRRRAARMAEGRPRRPLARRRRSSSSRTSRCGPSMPTGAGAPTMPREALKLLARFGSVTVLNGHIHQITQKVEGRIAFHTARSTAFPQPAPGTAPSPGPLKVPAEQLHSMLGITDATVRPRSRPHRADRFHPFRLTPQENPMTRAFKILTFQAAVLAGAHSLMARRRSITQGRAPAGAAVVSIDNFTFKAPGADGEARARRSPGPTATTFRTPSSPRTAASSRRCSTPATAFPSPSPRPGNSAISARCTRT